MSDVKLDEYDAQELADYMLQTNNTDSDYEVTENALVEKWNIDMDTFNEIADKLFQMIDFTISPLTDTALVGFSKGNEWIAKKEVDAQFIGGVIQWCTGGETIPEGKKFKRVITHKGVPEFEIFITKAVEELPTLNNNPDGITKQ